MFNIFLQEIDDRRQGIIVRNKIEVKGAPDKMFGTVGKVELIGGSCIRTADLINQPKHFFGRVNIFPLTDGIGFRNVLVHQGVCVVEIACQISADGFITDVQLGIIRIVNNIDPIGFSHPGTVANDLCIHGILESIGESGIKQPVFLYGKIDPVITTGLGNIAILAGEQGDGDECD